MKYAFTYIDTATGDRNMEVSTDWGMWWDYDRKGEITILSVDMTTDDWETCVTVFDLSEMQEP